MKARKIEATASAAVSAGIQQAGAETDLVMDAKDIPFNIHDSHLDVIYCGGYAGCMHCGLFASCEGAKNNLAKPRRKTCPAGTKGNVRRLTRGKHPIAGSAKTWPDGSSFPRPFRVKRL